MRQGFRKLLDKRLSGIRYKIIMGGGVGQTVGKFLNNRFEGDSYLLIDLDGSESRKSTVVQKYKLAARNEQIFFMIQEMEAWFFSQSEVLEAYYGKSISSKLPKTSHAGDISKPSAALMTITKGTSKGKYQKVRHGVDLLQELDADKLMGDFEDFKGLIEKLGG